MKRISAALLCVLMIFLSFPYAAIKTDAAFSGSDKINIVLDPGHGGGNIGASTRGIAEKTYTFSLAKLIKAELENNGSFNVYMTRDGDYDLELFERAEVANSYNADILISLHFDGNPSPSVHGVTTYTSVFDTYAAVSLSSSIATEISSATGLKNNGVRRREDNAGYYWNFDRQWDCQDPSLGTLSDYYGIPTWCAKFGIPSIIVEHGYFSNAGDSAILCADGALEKIAKAEARAIINYYTNHTHVYSASKRDFPSNCMYTGKQSEHCSVCGHRRNVVSLAAAPTNHYWVTKENTPASCGRDGKLVLECRITQNLKDKGWNGSIHMSTEIIPAPTDHTYEMTADVKATHTENGYQTWKCKTCSSTFTEIIEAEGHSFEFVGYTAPTCTKEGGNTYKCTVCSHSYTDKEAATGHSFEITDKTDPTCLEEGKQDKKCTVCGHEETDHFDALGHSLPESATIAPTCTEDGSIKGNCQRCNEVIDEVIEKTGHTFEITEEIPPTCTENGSLTKTCKSCGYTEQTLLKAEGHLFDRTVTVSATCEKEGSATLTCSVCKHTETETVKALGHQKSAKPSSKTEATAFSAGSIEYTCENGCGKIFTEKLEPTISKSTAVLIMGITGVSLAAVLFATVFIIVKKTKKAQNVPSDKAPETETEVQEKSAEELSDRPEEDSSAKEPAEESKE